MKKTYLLLLALSFCVIDGIFAQTEQKDYYPLIPETGEKQWDTRRDFIWGESDYYICWFGDNIELDGVMYRTLMGILDNPYHSGLVGALREENKKVYARWWSSGLQYYREEVLYYDFGLQVGDWFSVGDEDEPWYIMVESIDEVTMGDGSVRNAIVFNEGWGDEKETWIEGVGSLAGVTHRYDPNLVTFLICSVISKRATLIGPMANVGTIPKKTFPKTLACIPIRPME